MQIRKSFITVLVQAPIWHLYILENLHVPENAKKALNHKLVELVKLGKSVDTASLEGSGALSGPTSNIIKHLKLLSHLIDAHPVLDGPSRLWALHQGWSGWPNALSPYDLRCPSPLHYTPHLHARPTNQIVSVAVHTTYISREIWKGDFIRDCCILSLLCNERNSRFRFRSDSSVVHSTARKWRSLPFEDSSCFFMLLLHFPWFSSPIKSRSLIFRSFGMYSSLSLLRVTGPASTSIPANFSPFWCAAYKAVMASTWLCPAFSAKILVLKLQAKPHLHQQLKTCHWKEPLEYVE